MKVNNFYFLINSLSGGGAERVLVWLNDYLKPQKIFLLEKDVKYKIDKSLLVFLSSHSQKTNIFLKMFFVPIYSWRLAKKINNESIVLSFLWRANYVNIFGKFFKKHKAIISIHSDLERSLKGLKFFHKFLIKFLYPKADLIISPSKNIAFQLEKQGIKKEKIKIIYNPISIKEIEEKKKEKIEKIFEKSDFLINVGRLTKEKGQWFLLRIFKKIKQSFPKLKLLILGQGELENYLVKFSEKLSLKTFVWDKDQISENFDVYFLGFKKNPFKYMANAKIFILTSLWEGLPVSLIEALACGVPVICADCGSGPREILAPDTDFRKSTQKPEIGKYGILMPPFREKFLKPDSSLTKEEKNWVDKILWLLKDENEKEKFSKKGKERALDFDINKIIKKWKEIFY